MMTGFWFRYSGAVALGFGLAGAANYGLMMGTTLAHLEEVSGARPLDMRPFGYGPQDAANLFDALGHAGRSYYLTRQLPLDTIYPALLAVTLVCVLLWLGRPNGASRIVRIGISLSVGAALFDYAENLGIALMILKWPDISDGLVHLTSTASIAKSLLTTLAVLALVLVSAIRARDLWAGPWAGARRRPGGHTPRPGNGKR